MASRLSFSPKSLLLGSWRNKLFAFFLAVVIWVFAYGNETVERTIEFEVTIATTEDYMVVEEKIVTGRNRDRYFEQKVVLTLTGQKGELDRFEAKKEHFATIVVPPGGDGIVDLKLSEPYDLPGGVKIEGAEPAALNCTIEKVETRSIPVERAEVTPIVGQLDPGLGNPQFTFSPSTVQVRAPVGAFDREVGTTSRLAVRIDPIALEANDRGPDFQRESVRVKLSFPDRYHAGQVKIVGTKTVDVGIRMESLREPGNLANVPVLFVLPAGAFVREGAPKAVNLEIRGPKSLIDQVKRLNQAGEITAFVRAKIDFDLPLDFELGDLRLDPPLPPGVELRNITTGTAYKVESGKVD